MKTIIFNGTYINVPTNAEVVITLEEDGTLKIDA